MDENLFSQLKQLVCPSNGINFGGALTYAVSLASCSDENENALR
jgi:hypothetical protein